MGVGVLGGGGYNYCVKMSGEMLFHYLCIVAYVCVCVCMCTYLKRFCVTYVICHFTVMGMFISQRGRLLLCDLCFLWVAMATHWQHTVTTLATHT